jgi:hypothetical protein
MESVLDVLMSHKYTTESIERISEDGITTLRTFKDEKGLVSVFYYTSCYMGTLQACPDKAWERIILNKKTCGGRWTPKQLQNLRALGFVVERGYAQRSNIP